jgi:hypothetical protein
VLSEIRRAFLLWKGSAKFQKPIPPRSALLGRVKANFDDDKRSRWLEGLDALGSVVELLGEVVGFLFSALLELLGGF